MSKHGLMWHDASKAYGPHKAISNRFIRWSRLGVFNRIFVELAGKARQRDRIMIDAPDVLGLGYGLWPRTPHRFRACCGCIRRAYPRQRQRLRSCCSKSSQMQTS